ncbi:DJ-1/PfpI family protein [Micromonospora globbae]|uniref:DJ-1/PfpI family protein n=1 Tax=Micromonospora globbae TaxID=1894969 RepID=UPI00342E76DF
MLGAQGANVADLLAPYEVLADTGGFNLYTVAAERRPVTLTGGLDLLPDLTFAELNTRIPAGPDVIVVPQLVGAGTPAVAAEVEWLREQVSAGDPLVMSVCVGAKVLADAGLLDGRPATSHWLGLIGLRRDYPQVRWRDGVRFVEDGDDLITTAGVLTGVDGALRVVERLLGPQAATRTARNVHWTTYRPGPNVPAPQPRLAAGDTVALLSAAYRWDRPALGVRLRDGVGEIELASVFRPYTELSYLAEPLAFSTDGGPIRSRHGLTFTPRVDATAARDQVDRVIVPGTPDAVAAGPADRADEEFPFDAALRDIAAHYDAATARWVSKSLQYTPAGPLPAGPAWPWPQTLRALLLAVLGVAGTWTLRAGLRAVRNRRQRTRQASARATLVPVIRALPRPARRRFVRHYLEMALAMLVGMSLLGPLESWLLGTGWDDLRAAPEFDAMMMATNMTVAMVAWMLWRRHSGSATGKMAAAMYAAFLLPLPLLWLGTLSTGAFLTSGHVLMFVAMAAVMLCHVEEYAGHPHPRGARPDPAAPDPRPVTTVGTQMPGTATRGGQDGVAR